MNFKRLEDKLEWVFIFCLWVSSLLGLAIYSVLLKTVFAINTSLGHSIYIYAIFLIVVFSIYLYFQVQKFKNGKKINITKIYFYIEIVGTLVLAASMYTMIMVGNHASPFELFNIRLMLSFLLAFLNPTIAIFSFEFFRKRIYKNRYIKELDLPISYKIIPATMSAAIIALSLIRGIHYKSEVKISHEYNYMNLIKNASATTYNVYSATGDILTRSDGILQMIKIFSQNHTVKTIERYESVIGGYIVNLLSYNKNVKSCSVFLENDYLINASSVGESLYTTWGTEDSSINSLKGIENPIPIHIYEEIIREQKTVIAVDYSQKYEFLTYSPIYIDGNYKGFISIAFSKNIFTPSIAKLHRDDINTIILDYNYNIGYASDESDVEIIYDKLNNDTNWTVLRDEDLQYKDNVDFSYSDLIQIKNDNYNVVKWRLNNGLIILNIWKVTDAFSDFVFYKTVVFSTIINLVCILFIYLFLIFLLKTTIQAISKAKDIAESVGRGAGDLTLRLPVDRNDEVGELLNAFNMFLGKVNTIIESIKNNAYILTGNVQTMRSSIATSLNDFRLIQAEFDAEIEAAKKISDTSSNAAHVSYLQRSKFITVNNTIQSLLDNISIINSHMQDQSSAVEKTSASVHQMMASIVTVGQGANKANNYAKTLYSEAYEGSVIGQDVMDSIQNIREFSKQITNITHVINNIAEQTNLLAMNAAIEAAHAREHGRGFAVVADKIRKLAEDTSDNSKIINDLIQDTTNAIDHTVELSLKSNHSIEKIVEDTGDLAKLIATISQANEELDVGRRDILLNIKNLNLITETVQDLSIQQRTMSDEVSESISSVDKLAEDVLNVVNSNEDEIRILLDSINTVSSLSTTSNANLKELENNTLKVQSIFLELYKLVTLFKSGRVQEDTDTKTVKKKHRFKIL